MRFLFRLGDKRTKDESLLESFEQLLAELGIQIEFNTEESVAQDATQEITRNDNRGIGQQSQRRSRRASFNSMYDAEDESTRVIRSRANSRASVSRLQIGDKPTSKARPSTRATFRPTEKTFAGASPNGKRIAHTTRGRLTAAEFANDLRDLQHQRVPVSRKSEQEIHRKHAPTSSQTPALDHAASSTDDISNMPSAAKHGTTDEAPSVRKDEQPFPLTVRERFYAPSRTQLLRDAETFQHYRIRSVARDIVDRWCDAALQASKHHEHLERMAVAHDTEILLRQAFEHWRARLHSKKQAAETTRFFNHLERRAVKARNLYLLTKAFTHWAQCAQDEALRSSLARQHALGIKYFYTWRNITVENQNKVQQQGLKKFFGVWKQRYVRSLTDGIKADLLYQQSLLRNGYWHWFWNFCERRAPEWYVQRLKQRLFLQLVSRHRNSVRQLQVVTQNANSKAKKNILLKWMRITRVCLSNERQAITFNQQKIAGHVLGAWIRKRRLTPSAQQVSNMVDWRVAGATFATFVNRFRFEKQADNISRLRILRSVWTQWNDRLRWQTMAHRIDDRYLLETLYKWVVAARCILMRRLSDERLKRRFLQEWLLQVSMRKSSRERALEAFETKVSDAYLRGSLVQWRSQLVKQQQAQQVAVEFHAPKVALEAVKLWQHNHRHVQQINLWAQDANFFFLGKRYLKRWREATCESRRQKRREAYIKVRRRSKMSLASSYLHHWRTLAFDMVQSQRQADNVNQQRLLRVGTRFFDHWKNAFDFTIDHDFDAQEHLEKQTLKRFLTTWTERAGGIREFEETARINADLRAQKTAFVFLRKLRLKMIELSGQQGKAEGLKINYEKRHFHNVLRQWRDKTATRQNRPQEDRSFSARTRRTRRQVEDDGLAAMRSAEDWTELDVGDWIPNVEPSSSTTPLPGYLATPSKRAARANALVQSTTPAGTPFQNRLRAQLNATPRTAKRGPFGRSSILRGNMFGAILEDSPSIAGDLPLQNNE